MKKLLIVCCCCALAIVGCGKRKIQKKPAAVKTAQTNELLKRLQYAPTSTDPEHAAIVGDQSKPGPDARACIEHDEEKINDVNTQIEGVSAQISQSLIKVQEANSFGQAPAEKESLLEGAKWADKGMEICVNFQTSFAPQVRITDCQIEAVSAEWKSLVEACVNLAQTKETMTNAAHKIQ